VDVLEKGLQLKPDMTAALLFLGIDLYQLRRYQEALPLLRRARDVSPQDPLARLYLGACYLSVGSVEESISELEKAAELSPRDVEVLHTLGQAYLSQSKVLFDRSRQLYSRVLEMEPDSYRTHQILAEAYLAQEQPQKAIDSYREAIRLKPGDASLRFALADLYFRQGAYDLAREPLEKVIQIDGGHNPARLELAVIANLDQDFDTALLHLRQVLAANDENPDAYLELGKALAGREELEEALRALAKAAELSPLDPAPQYQLGVICRRLGRAQEAQQHLRIFQELEASADRRRQEDALRTLGRTP